MESAFAAWLRTQPRGTMSKIARKTGLSFVTVDRAKKGLKVQAGTAKVLSKATRHRVAVRDIPQVEVGKDRDLEEVDDSEPRRVA